MRNLFKDIIKATKDLTQQTSISDIQKATHNENATLIEKRLANAMIINEAIAHMEMLNLDKMPTFIQQCEQRYYEHFQERANLLESEIQTLTANFGSELSGKEREDYDAEISNLLHQHGFTSLRLDMDEKEDTKLRKQATNEVRSSFNFINFLLSNESGFNPSIHFKTNFYRAFNFLAECFSESALTKCGFMKDGEPITLSQENKAMISRMIILAAVLQLYEHEKLEEAKPQITAVMANLKNPDISSETQRAMLHEVMNLGKPISGANKEFDSVLPRWMATIEKGIANNELLSRITTYATTTSLFAHPKSAKPSGLESKNSSSNSSPTTSPRPKGSD